jgi:hypothetical protein
MQLLSSARCHKEIETASNILCECEDLDELKFRRLGNHFLEPSDYDMFQSRKILYFARSTGLLQMAMHNRQENGRRAWVALRAHPTHTHSFIPVQHLTCCVWYDVGVSIVHLLRG